MSEEQGASTSGTVPVGTAGTVGLPTPSKSGHGGAKKRHEDKRRRKDPKSWENVSKAIAQLSDADKISFIQKKYVEIYNESRELQGSNQEYKRQFMAMQKEKDHYQGEFTKSVLARARLEDLCRELQKQNKQIKEQNAAKIKEEEERRKEISEKFNEKLHDINAIMDENKEKSEKLREENQKMTHKLSELYKQFQRREDDVTRMGRQLDLERQLSEASLAKKELELQAEREKHIKEETMLKVNCRKTESNSAALMETIKALQGHIEIYKSQYDEFEASMLRNSSVLESLKKELANKTKTIEKSNKETDQWKIKYQECMKALVEANDARRKQEMYLHNLQKKLDQLQKLCRQLQTDRAEFLKLLKTNGIEPPGTEETFAVASTSAAKPAPKTKKEKELEILKESLQAVQDELTRISLDEEKKTEESSTAGPSTSEVTVPGPSVFISNSSSMRSTTRSPNPESSIIQKNVVIIDNDRGYVEEFDYVIDNNPPGPSHSNH